ncbi:hypothetical protein ACJJTC_015898 [Scirpophaga incertulas]
MVYTVSVSGGRESKCAEASSWKGVLFSFIATLPFFTHGLESTELFSSSHSGHFVISPETTPWNATAFIVAAALSAPIYWCIIDKFGRITGLFVLSLAQGISCIPLFLAPGETITYILHGLTGTSMAGLFIAIPTYVCEINTPAYRGLSLSFMMLMSTVGCLMRLVMKLEIMMYLMAALIAIQLLSLLILLESPSYLVKVDRITSAREKISKLKCLEDDNLNLLKELEALQDESYRAKAKGKITLIQIFRNLIWRDATKIGILLHTTMAFCGSVLFLDQDKTLQQIQLPSDPDKKLILIALCTGSIFTVFVMKFIERKHLLAFGNMLMVLSMGVLAVFTQVDLTVTSFRWMPVVALAVLVFGFGICWGFPTIISVEIYNFEVRVIMMTLLFFYAQLIKLFHVHTYQYVEDYVGVYTFIYLFAAINLYGGVYGLFVIPDIKNKTLKQIERQLKRIPLIKL